MFCPKCGAQMPEGAVVCANCANAANAGYQQVPAAEDKPSAGLNVLSFFFPIVGLVLYLVWMKDTPVKAKGCGKWALIGFIVSFVLGIVFSIISTIITAGMMNSYY